MTNLEKKILQLVKKANPNDPTQYVNQIVKQYARDKLDFDIAHCQSCNISNKIRTVTFGPTDARLIVLTDMALPEQQKYGYPLENTASFRVVKEAFTKCNINMEDCFFINAVNCCPYSEWKNNVLYRIPNLEEKEACKPFLKRALDIIRPNILLILGNIGLNSLIKTNINIVRGKLIDVCGIPTVATFSPEYILWCKDNDSNAYECDKNIFLKDISFVAEQMNK